jgi:GNAT superfamily N-acetyltransferase
VPVSTSLPIRDKRADDQAWVERLLRERWGGTQVVTAGVLLDAGSLPALVAGERQGLLTWRHLEQRAAELVTLDALQRRQGVGSALLVALVERLRMEGLARLHVTTTNDNLDALRFYQRRGFRIVAVRPGAVEAARIRKPTIPEVGDYGIPLRDEIELRRELPGAR